ncbi:P-loop containing nucleoside triphosphate hydrolase protein [Syncephalis plumigaleata]|nr:P-loop containing nucleoside triphosphate hydrolase protein [Syncephalis plumigaleata]
MSTATSNTSVVTYEVLFTHQKTKKAKTWQDGFITACSQTSKVVLYDNDKARLTIELGEQYDMDRYLVQVEGVLSSPITNSNVSTKENTDKEIKDTPAVTRNKPKLLKGRFKPPSFTSAKPSSIPTSSANNAMQTSNQNNQKPNRAACTSGDTPVGTETEDIQNVVVVKKRKVGLTRPVSLKLERTHSIDTHTSDQPKHDAATNDASTAAIKPAIIMDSHLFFPSNASVLAGMSLEKATTHNARVGTLKRQLKAPLRYASISAYRKIFTRLIYEHLQVLLGELSVRFHAVALDNRYSGQNAMEKFYRSRGISLYTQCLLNGHYSASRHSSMANDSFSLKLNQYEASTSYAKDDLWILSKDRFFKLESTFLARSTFYGPSSATGQYNINEGDIPRMRQFQVENAELYAIRAFNASSEYTMLDTLENETVLENTPIVSAILSHTIRSTNTSDTAVFTEFIEIINEKYNLNEDQQRVMVSFADMLTQPKHRTIAPLLVHGVFGAGKSAVYCKYFESMARQEGKPPHRLLITAMTNVAVDNILEGLIQIGYHEFVRVGSLKKINKKILPYTAHASSDPNKEQQELNELLQTMPKEENDDNITASILDPSNHRKDRIQKALIVGTTCLATTLPVFDGQRFDVVILDEACQIMEPMSLLPLVRFNSSRAVLIGDPLQLPPTVETRCDNQILGHGLDRSLFERCMEMGIKCHPRIAAISNDLVYRNCLINGVTPAQRDPILDQLSTLAFIDVPGEECQASRSGSLYNEMEVTIIVQTVRQLLQSGVAAQDIGVISLYKAQVERIESRLGLHDCLTNKSTGSNKGALQVSTVDAFQGAEREIIILSCVRTKYIGFLSNLRRINVAFTRAKRHLLVMGRSNLLSTHRIWRQFIEQHCKAYPHGYYSSSQFQKTLAQLAPSDTLVTSSPHESDQVITPTTSFSQDIQHETPSSISKEET